uniref:Uncharacterized protein n=1 Tax=Sphaerodactylus townsendi TaxID=933632 RepID=A0ACB8ECQ1_9SAUR
MHLSQKTQLHAPPPKKRKGKNPQQAGNNRRRLLGTEKATWSRPDVEKNHLWPTMLSPRSSRLAGEEGEDTDFKPLEPPPAQPGKAEAGRKEKGEGGLEGRALGFFGASEMRKSTRGATHAGREGEGRKRQVPLQALSWGTTKQGGAGRRRGDRKVLVEDDIIQRHGWATEPTHTLALGQSVAGAYLQLPSINKNAQKMWNPVQERKSAGLASWL